MILLHHPVVLVGRRRLQRNVQSVKQSNIVTENVSGCIGFYIRKLVLALGLIMVP